MSATSTIAVIAVVGILAFAVVAIKARAAAGGSGSRPAFKRKVFLTPNELEFLARLEASAPELSFHAQVSMGALLDPAASRKDGKEYFRARGMFSQKIVDFVAQAKADVHSAKLVDSSLIAKRFLDFSM